MVSHTLHGDYPLKTVTVLEHLMGKMIAGTRAAPVQVGCGYPKPNWDQRQITLDPSECPILATD